MSFPLADSRKKQEIFLVNMGCYSMAANSPKEKKYTKRGLRSAEQRIIFMACSDWCEEVGDGSVEGGSALLEACRRVMLER